MKQIGILLDDLKIKKWQKKIIEFIENHPRLKLEVLVLNSNKPTTGDPKHLYRIFQAVDRKLFKVENDAFAMENYNFNPTIPVISIKGIETRFSYKFPEDNIEEIKSFNLDILIRFGFGILKGEILNVPKYGIWSLHHGDNEVNRGGPPGFWEVVNREEVTGATLQILSPDLDGGKVILKGYSKTNFTSFNRNKNEVFWSGVELFTSSLHEMANNIGLKKLAKAEIPKFYSHPLYKDPKNLESLEIHLNFWTRRIIEIILELINPPQWFLLYKHRKNNLIETSVFRYKKLIPPKGYDWADPFVVHFNYRYFVFFEELHIKTGKAHISYLEFDPEGELIQEFPKKVLEEDHHLSYPFIFKEKGIFYMLPESANSGELWLYECVNFPEVWEKKKIIFKDKAFYDATLYKYNNIWYLFGTEKILLESSRDQYLFIYYTEDLFTGDWKSHPINPVYRDVRNARPAGRIFMQEGKLIRPSQIGAPKYGYGIQFNEIINLSPDSFTEIKIDKILPFWEKNLVATHTYNSEKGFTVLDAQGLIKR